MFVVQSLETITNDNTLSFEDKQLMMVLYSRMLQTARCDMTVKEMSDLTGIDEEKIEKQIAVLRKKGYLVGPNMAL